MAASDLLQEVGLPGSATILSAPGYTIGDSTINVASTANWPTATGVTFAIDRVVVENGQQVRIDGTYCEFVGDVASGTQISNIVKTVGDAQDYPAGTQTRVYIPVSSTRENRLVEWGLTHANQDGTLKDIATNKVGTTALKNFAVTPDKVAAPTIVRIDDDTSNSTIASGVALKSLEVPAGTWLLSYKWGLSIVANSSGNSRASLHLGTNPGTETHKSFTEHAAIGTLSSGNVGDTLSYFYKQEDVVTLASPTTFRIWANNISDSAVSLCDIGPGYIKAIKLSGATS